MAALERITPWMIKAGADGARATGVPIVSIFLHKGFHAMMSDAQFRTFYWPTLREVIMGLINEGLTPYVFTEGDYTSRLEALKDVPRGKVIYHIEKDLFEAKAVLGDVACLTGGPPNSPVYRQHRGRQGVLPETHRRRRQRRWGTFWIPRLL